MTTKTREMLKGKSIPISVTIGFIVFIAIAIVTNLFKSDDLPIQITGALLEAVVTALITYFLLTGQSQQEESKERSMKVFEKKQEVYYNFLERLKAIIQDGEISIGAKNEVGIDNSIDELKDLIFQFAYLQLHTSETTINSVLDGVARIVQRMNDFGSTNEMDKQKELPGFYSSLSEEVFAITTILKRDLYGEDSNPISKEKMTNILRECNLFIETKGFDKYELQIYFWDELQRQLRELGYGIKQNDFNLTVQEYYARARNRKRYFGFVFPVLANGKEIEFAIEVSNSYYYGFGELQDSQKNDELANLIRQTSSSFKKTGGWAGWKYSDRYDIDFWNLTPEERFKELNDPRKREKLIENIAKEMDMYIRKVQHQAEQAGF